jgi:hypothetical protein
MESVAPAAERKCWADSFSSATLISPGDSMKTNVIATVVAGGSFAVAQTVVPVDQEPQHHLALENAYIKVLDAVFLPATSRASHRRVE